LRILDVKNLDANFWKEYYSPTEIPEPFFSAVENWLAKPRKTLPTKEQALAILESGKGFLNGLTEEQTAIALNAPDEAECFGKK
jgi:hypothetical protein